jgi:uncharacterized membrane protein
MPTPKRKRRPTTDLTRILLSVVISGVVAAIGTFVLGLVGYLDVRDFAKVTTTSFVLVWPVYTLVYVGWSLWTYSRLDGEELDDATAIDERSGRNWALRIMGFTGTTSVTIGAATVAIVVTILIAQQPETREDGAYIVGTLATVAASWVLVAYAFAQRYVRLTADRSTEHLVFRFSGRPRFMDHMTLAVMISAMAPMIPAEAGSRTAWRIIRTNVLIAFVFNSVIIAMMVTLLFGSILS